MHDAVPEGTPHRRPRSAVGRRSHRADGSIFVVRSSKAPPNFGTSIGRRNLYEPRVQSRARSDSRSATESMPPSRFCGMRQTSIAASARCPTICRHRRAMWHRAARRRALVRDLLTRRTPAAPSRTKALVWADGTASTSTAPAGPLHAPGPAWARLFELERDRLHAPGPGALVQFGHVGGTVAPVSWRTRSSISRPQLPTRSASTRQSTASATMQARQRAIRRDAGGSQVAGSPARHDSPAHHRPRQQRLGRAAFVRRRTAQRPWRSRIATRRRRPNWFARRPADREGGTDAEVRARQVGNPGRASSGIRRHAIQG